jgi:hypothetical protein
VGIDLAYDRANRLEKSLVAAAEYFRKKLIETHV